MKNQKSRKVLLTIIIVILLLSSIAIIFHQKKSSLTPQQSSPSEEISNNKTINTQTTNGIQFSQINYSFDGYYTLIEYTITNTTKQSITIQEYEIIIKDKDNQIIANLTPSLNLELKPNESYTTGNSIDIQLEDGISIEFSILN